MNLIDKVKRINVLERDKMRLATNIINECKKVSIPPATITELYEHYFKSSEADEITEYICLKVSGMGAESALPPEYINIEIFHDRHTIYAADSINSEIINI